MFAVTVTFHLYPGQLKTFLPLMVENAQTSLRTEPGCHQFDVCHGGTDDTVFLYELYEDAAAFDAHLAAAHFKTFSAKTAEMIVDKTIATFPEVLQ